MKYTAIDKKFVHKVREENVLLANIRRVLPSYIDSEVYEKLVCTLNSNEVACVERILPVDIDGLFGEPGGRVNRELLGASRLSIAEHEKIRETLIPELKDEFDEVYRLVGEEHVLRSVPGDTLLYQIIRISEKHDFYVDNTQKSWLSLQLETLLSDEHKGDVFFANLSIDTNHEFFFEHPNEHVPGLMVLEASRQMIIACAHVFGGVPLDGAQMILDLLEAKFTGYMELYSPITLRAEVMRKKVHRGAWSSVALDISLYQNGQKMGLVTCSGNHIGYGVFKRIRRMKSRELSAFPFVPNADLEYTFLIKDGLKGTWREAVIEHMNLHQIFLGGQGLETCLGDAPDLDFILLVPRIGSVKGMCRSSAASDGKQLDIASIDASDGDNFELILKRYCNVPEEVLL